MTDHLFFYLIKNVRISTLCAKKVVPLHAVVLKTKKRVAKCVRKKIFFSVFYVCVCVCVCV